MELWGFENQRSLPGYGVGLFQFTRPQLNLGNFANALSLQPIPATPAAPTTSSTTTGAGAGSGTAAANEAATAAASGGGMSPWIPAMMGVGMLGQAGASVANTASNASAQVSVANAQANAMILATQAQANAAIFNAQSQANVAIHNSDNQLEAAKDHNDVMRIQIQENSLTAKFALMTSLAERLDQNFTALQIVTRGAQIAEREERNRHREAMEGLRLQEKQLEHPTIDTQDLLGRFS